MIVDYRKLRLVTLLIVCFCMLAGDIANAAEADDAVKKRPLQIVFILGQSEKVGDAKVSAASYMLQKPLIPPREATLNAHKAMLHQINGAYLYWQAMNSYDGPAEKQKQLKALLVERDTFRKTFKQHVLDQLKKNDGMFRGKHYSSRRGFWLFNMVDQEAEKVGITPKIRAILDAPDNTFNLEKAYEQILADSNNRYKKQLKLNELILNGTTPEDFVAFSEATKAFEAEMKKSAALTSVEERRLAYAALAEKHLHLPIAKRTHVVVLGKISDTPEDDVGNLTHGRLSVGYGSEIDTFGLEYAAGITLESKIDAPILIVKCGWESVLTHVKAVLDNPGKYHPEYDPEVGYEVAGMIWLEGMSDRQNQDYGLHLESILREFRTFVKSPEIPVVCATVGTMLFKGESDDSLVNQGMREVANKPEFKGSVDVVETYKSYPSEIALINSMFHKRKLNDKELLEVIQRSTGIRGRRSPPYMGSASFYLLAGHELGESLARMIAGDKPVVPKR